MNRQKFYDALRRRDSGVFGSRLSSRQIEGIEGILDAFMSHGDASSKTLAYVLAAAYHGTDRRMVPVREGLARTERGARRTIRQRARQAGTSSKTSEHARPQPPYNHVYYGRGHLQLTGKEAYEQSSRDAGVDLVQNPDKMLDPVISARVLIKGLINGRWNQHGNGLLHYLQSDDLLNARHTINVSEKWTLVAGYYHAFLPAIREAGGVPYISTPLTRSEPPSYAKPVRKVSETAQPVGLLAGVFASVANSFPFLRPKASGSPTKRPTLSKV